MWVNLDEIDFDGTNAKHQGGLFTKRATSPNSGEIYIGVGSGLLQFVLSADPAQNGVGTFSTSNRLSCLKLLEILGFFMQKTHGFMYVLLMMELRS